MPQIELKYTKNLSLENQSIFETIEQTIHALDPASGACKSRVIKIQEYHHSHIFLHIYMLKKSHRDVIFTQKLLEQINQNTKIYFPNSEKAELSILIEYLELGINYFIR